MNKIISIFISSLILLQSLNINIDEIKHLDTLMEHAYYHAEKYGDDIFLFVSKHYGELKKEHNQDNHSKEHEELPFNHQCSPNYVSVFILQNPQIAIAKDSELASRVTFLYQESLSLFEKGDVFQPPRIS